MSRQSFDARNGKSQIESPNVVDNCDICSFLSEEFTKRTALWCEARELLDRAYETSDTVAFKTAKTYFIRVESDRRQCRMVLFDHIRGTHEGHSLGKNAAGTS